MCCTDIWLCFVLSCRVICHLTNSLSPAGSDYESVSSDLTFSSGTMDGANITVAIPITRDDVGEPDEAFMISLIPVTPDMADADVIIVTLVNDDSKDYCIEMRIAECVFSLHLLRCIYIIITVVDCGHPPSLENGGPEYNGTLLGEQATYMCDEGHQLTTLASQRTCTSCGFWSNEDIQCAGNSIQAHVVETQRIYSHCIYIPLHLL